MKRLFYVKILITAYNSIKEEDESEIQEFYAEDEWASDADEEDVISDVCTMAVGRCQYDGEFPSSAEFSIHSIVEHKEIPAPSRIYKIGMAHKWKGAGRA